MTAGFKSILKTGAFPPVILIRLMVGLVFLSEGIQKFLFPDRLGVGRFMKIGLPAPEILGPLVGGTEMLCGALLVLGLLSRPACLPLLLIIATAIITTKLGIIQSEGFWHMAHEARTDFCMLMGLMFLLISGGGKPSLDEKWLRQPDPHER